MTSSSMLCQSMFSMDIEVAAETSLQVFSYGGSMVAKVLSIEITL